MAASRRKMPTGSTTSSIPSCTRERPAISAPCKIQSDGNLRHEPKGQTIAYVSVCTHWKFVLPKEASPPIPGGCSPAPNDGSGSLAEIPECPSNVRFSSDCVAKLLLRRLTNDDSVGLRRHRRGRLMMGRRGGGQGPFFFFFKIYEGGAAPP